MKYSADDETRLILFFFRSGGMILPLGISLAFLFHLFGTGTYPFLQSLTHPGVLFTELVIGLVVSYEAVLRPETPPGIRALATGFLYGLAVMVGLSILIIAIGFFALSQLRALD